MPAICRLTPLRAPRNTMTAGPPPPQAIRMAVRSRATHSVLQEANQPSLTCRWMEPGIPLRIPEIASLDLRRLLFKNRSQRRGAVLTRPQAILARRRCSRRPLIEIRGRAWRAGFALKAIEPQRRGTCHDGGGTRLNDNQKELLRAGPRGPLRRSCLRRFCWATLRRPRNRWFCGTPHRSSCG
jgi:hypothetical protein